MHIHVYSHTCANTHTQIHTHAHIHYNSSNSVASCSYCASLSSCSCADLTERYLGRFLPRTAYLLTGALVSCKCVGLHRHEPLEAPQTAQRPPCQVLPSCAFGRFHVLRPEVCEYQCFPGLDRELLTVQSFGRAPSGLFFLMTHNAARVPSLNVAAGGAFANSVFAVNEFVGTRLPNAIADAKPRLKLVLCGLHKVLSLCQPSAPG